MRVLAGDIGGTKRPLPSEIGLSPARDRQAHPLSSAGKS
jgi:hypothetical protein